MTMLNFTELHPRGLSGSLWSGFAPPSGGGFERTASGNPAFGFFDDFLKVGGTSVADGYGRIQTGTGTVAQVQSTAHTVAGDVVGSHGVERLYGTADDDESILAYGAALDAPFKLITTDLCFECRVAWSSIAADAHGQFIGLGELGSCVTLKVFTAADPPIFATDYDFLGFRRLQGETSALDGFYQVGGQTLADGASNTDLDTLHTIVAAEYVKLGFRFRAADKTIHWFVNGVEDKAAMLKIDGLTAGTFPDDNFMTPTAAQQCDGTAANSFDIDWWACAQME